MARRPIRIYLYCFLLLALTNLFFNSPLARAEGALGGGGTDGSNGGSGGEYGVSCTGIPGGIIGNSVVKYYASQNLVATVSATWKVIPDPTAEDDFLERDSLIKVTWTDCAKGVDVLTYHRKKIETTTGFGVFPATYSLNVVTAMKRVDANTRAQLLRERVTTNTKVDLVASDGTILTSPQNMKYSQTAFNVDYLQIIATPTNPITTKATVTSSVRAVAGSADLPAIATQQSSQLPSAAYLSGMNVQDFSIDYNRNVPTISSDSLKYNTHFVLPVNNASFTESTRHGVKALTSPFQTIHGLIDFLAELSPSGISQNYSGNWLVSPDDGSTVYDPSNLPNFTLKFRAWNKLRTNFDNNTALELGSMNHGTIDIELNLTDKSQPLLSGSPFEVIIGGYKE